MNYPYLSELYLLEGLRVTELMYNAPQGEGLDYIELRNVTNVPLDLTGVRFTAGVDFTFPVDDSGPRRAPVVAADPAAFRSRYGAEHQRGGAVHRALEQQRRGHRPEAACRPSMRRFCGSAMPTCGIRPRTAAASP